MIKISGSKKHSFVCVDTEAQKIVWVDENGAITKEMSGILACFDVWVLPDGRLLYPHFGNTPAGEGFTILNTDGTIATRYQTQHEVFCCQPLPDGNVLVGELGQKRMVEVNPKGEVVKEIAIPYEGNQHECMRMVRKTATSYLVVQPGLNLIRRLSFAGEVLKEYAIHPDAFGVVELPNGHLVYTCMSGAYELDNEGNEVWSLTDADVPEMNIRWLLGIQLLANGNYVLSNWMGHGHQDEGIHFFEVNREKQVVWSCDSRGTLLQPATLQILDEDATKVCFTPLK